MNRPAPESTARKLIDELFPDCLAAVVGGSVVRGDATETSDLDITLIVPDTEEPRRWSMIYDGWPVELFIHTRDAFSYFSSNDTKRRMPTIHMLWAEGTLVRDVDGLGTKLKEHGRAIIEAGPKPLTQAEINGMRYFITDLLDDIKGGGPRSEMLMAAHTLAGLVVDLYLGLHGAWTGKSKWTIRALRRHDVARADALERALEAFASADDAAPLISFAEEVLEEAGGRLFEGYTVTSGERIEKAKRDGWEPEAI